jgi:hypothetical protein
MYAASLKTQTSTDTRARAGLSRQIHTNVCVYKLFISSVLQNIERQKHQRREAASRLAQHNHLAICSTQSPRDLLNTTT